MDNDLVNQLKSVAFAIEDDDEIEVVFVTGDLLLEAAREIEYLRARVARLEGLA